jgi:hypothetical protein
MGIVYNTSIVRDGLVLHLDVANVKSYPGNGTVWNDLSNTKAVCTAVNGPVYEAPYFTFDGTNDYFYIDNSLVYGGGATLPEMSAFAWIRTTYNSGTVGVWNNSNWSLLDFDRSEVFSFALNGTGEIQMSGASSNYGGFANLYDLVGNTRYNDGKWHYVGWTFSVAEQKITMYGDGEVDRVFTANGSMTALGSGVARYGIIGDGSESTAPGNSTNSIYYSGDIGSIKFYNRALSALEVRKNYEAARDRYAVIPIPIILSGVFNTDFASTEDTSSTQTFNNMNLGTPQANRYIAVVTQNFNTSATETVSISVNGSPTTFQSTGDVGQLPGAIGLIPYPTGTTADISVDFGNTITRGIVGVYAVYGPTTINNFATSGGFTTVSNGSSYSLQQGDFVLGSIYVTDGVGLTPSGLTNDDVAIILGRYLSIDSYGPAPAAGTFNYNWSWNNSTSYRWHTYVLR